MKSNERQKMCANCDGRISFEATECSYCGAEHTPINESDSTPLFKSQSLQSSLASLYTPPYSVRGATSSPQESIAPKKMESKKETSSPFFEQAAPMTAAASLPLVEEQEESPQAPVLPLLVLSVAMQFLILGLLQFFFSDHGFLRLQWDSSYWFIYCLVSLPLFFFGFKKISSLR